MLANKCDLDEANINPEELTQYCQDKGQILYYLIILFLILNWLLLLLCIEIGFEGWFDTSAKTNQNIDKAARFLVEKILEHQDIFNKKKINQVK